jgi:hypothetical protein
LLFLKIEKDIDFLIYFVGIVFISVFFDNERSVCKSEAVSEVAFLADGLALWLDILPRQMG